MCNFPESSLLDPTTTISTLPGHAISTSPGRIPITSGQFGGHSLLGQQPQLQSADSIEQLTVEEVQAILTSVSTGSTNSSSQAQSGTGTIVKKEPKDEETSAASRMLLVQSTQVNYTIVPFAIFPSILIQLAAECRKFLINRESWCVDCLHSDRSMFTCQN